MSAHNKARRKKPWQCTRCGARMDRRLGERTQAALDAANRPRGGTVDVVQICGECRAMHYPAGDDLRPLTPAEEFQLRVDCPRLMATFDSFTPDAVPTFMFGNK